MVGNLPIRMDIMNWARIPGSFHREEGGLDDFISASLKQGV